MPIREEDINALRERADLVQIASEKVALKKKGKYFWGCCPFHKEKTPSFKIDPALQLYHCFGCGEGGNVFTFVMKTENLPFGEAVRFLADRVGYSLRYDAAERKQSGRKRFYEINEEALRYYRHSLTQTGAGKKALEYLKSRGFTEKTIAEFDLGFSPDSWDSLTRYLLKKGVGHGDLVAIGLSIRGDKGLYDRFRGRIMFPIRELRGQVVAFGGRALGDASPKYLNSPETSIFKKSGMLYGLFRAKDEIAREGRALVVEGYTDVIALHQAGIRTAVATLGTAFTEEHLRLLSRFAERIVLVFDADAAGLRAAERGISHVAEFRMPGLESVRDLLNRREVEVKVAVLPSGLDPADMVRTSGPGAFAEVVDGAFDFMEFAIERMVERFDASTVAGKAKAARSALEVISSLDSAVAQEEYIKILAQKLGADLDFVLLELQRMGKRKRAPAFAQAPARDIQSTVEREFLKIVLQHPEFLDRAEGIGPEHFVSPVNQRVFLVLSERGGGKFERDLAADVELSSAVSGLMLEEISAEKLEEYFSDISARLKEFGLQRQINSLRLKLERMNPIRNSESYDELFGELLRLESAKRSLRERK